MKHFLTELRDTALFTVSVLSVAFLFVFSLQATHQGDFWLAMPAMMFVFAIYFIAKLVITGEPPTLITDDSFQSSCKSKNPPFWQTHGWKFWMAATLACAAFVIYKLIALVRFLV